MASETMNIRFPDNARGAVNSQYQEVWDHCLRTANLGPSSSHRPEFCNYACVISLTFLGCGFNQ